VSCVVESSASQQAKVSLFQERLARAPLGIDCELGLDARVPLVASHQPQRHLQARRLPFDYILLFLLLFIVVIIIVIVVVVIFIVIVALVGVARLLLWSKGQPSPLAVPRLN
jgi:Flp pilus assembly protein TadB